jgi:DNA-directed RNA polymerase subunit H (RpoH/RPB5)
MDNITDLKKVFNVCKELFKTRKYTIKEEGIDDTKGWYLKGHDRKNQPVDLYITLQSKLNVDLIKYYYSLFTTDNIKHAIIVYQDTFTASVKKILQSIDIHIELFQMKELKYNILKHVLVPKHTKVGAMKRNDEKYPIMKKSDPIARFIGFKYGDIIRIDRNDGSIYYRYVK